VRGIAAAGILATGGRLPPQVEEVLLEIAIDAMHKAFAKHRV
jgi:hypothetical protein